MQPTSRLASAKLAAWIETTLLAGLFGNGWSARFAYALGLQPHAQLITQTLRLNAPASVRRPLRVGFASDFHAGPTTHPKVITEACRLLAAAQPDILLLGGDLVSFHHRHVDQVIQAIKEIPAPLGRFAVFGNHDYWANHVPLTGKLERAGIQILTNRNQQLAPPYDDIWICGLDDPEEGQPDAANALEGAGPHRIVLMHSPDGILNLAPYQFMLALCGHTHGGQVALPSGKPLLLPRGHYCRPYHAGAFPLSDETTRLLLVSRGIGCSGLPVRAFAPPDVMLCILD